MPYIFNKLRKSLVLRVGLIYAVVAWIVVQVAEFAMSPTELHERYLEIIARNLIAVSPLLIFFTWMAEKLEPPDRRVFLLRMIWVLGPVLMAFIVGTILIYSDYAPGWPFDIFILLVFGFTSMIWVSMSNPFAREWGLRNARNREELKRLEIGIQSWFSTDDEMQATEIHITPKLYYSFLAGIGAVVFILVETVIGEFIDNSFGTGGYAGASIVALGIAAVIYPIHMRTSRRFLQSDGQIKSEGAGDIQSAATEIKRWSFAFAEHTIRRWYIYLPVVIGSILLAYLIDRYLIALRPL